MVLHFQAEEKAVRTALVQRDVSLHTVHIASDSMSNLQPKQNPHPSQQVANSDEIDILDALASSTNRECHLTFTRCPSHSQIRDNVLADVGPKEGTSVEQEWVSHHYDS